MAKLRFAAVNEEPISTINTTPMIDVMLVMIVMLIIALPRPTHKVAIDLPSASQSGEPPVSNQLGITSKGLYLWNSESISAAALQSQLIKMKTKPDPDLLSITTDKDAPYERFDEAERRKGNTGANLLMLLESRLDNVVYRMGFGSTRAEARQLVSHKAVMVNGKVVNIPSFSVKAGDALSLRDNAKKQLRIQDALKLADSIGMPGWVQVDAAKMEGVFKKAPDRDEFGADIKEALIVELYSR